MTRGRARRLAADLFTTFDDVEHVGAFPLPGTPNEFAVEIVTGRGTNDVLLEPTTEALLEALTRDIHWQRRNT